jgi:hypothetical protein
MENTRPNIILTRGVYVDIYAALNDQIGFPAVSVGTQLYSQNISSNVVRLYSKSTTPNGEDGYTLIDTFDTAMNEVGDLGAWALGQGIINVSVV